MSMVPDEYFDGLERGELFYFRDWPNCSVPQVAAGVYTIWEGDRFIYVGMSGRSLTEINILSHRESNAKGKGLFSRLNAHASGRRSGDQFCVYVSDMLVLPTLDAQAIQGIVNRKIFMDKLVRNYIHDKLSYRFIETTDGNTALHIETLIRKGRLTAGKPLLNPL